MSNRDKFLTEAMGECWHDVIITCFVDAEHSLKCKICKEYDPKQNNFSTWEGFGKLWEWVNTREDKMCNLATRYTGHKLEIECELINPDRFADAVYEYLKEVRGE